MEHLYNLKRFAIEEDPEQHLRLGLQNNPNSWEQHLNELSLSSNSQDSGGSRVQKQMRRTSNTYTYNSLSETETGSTLGSRSLGSCSSDSSQSRSRPFASGTEGHEFLRTTLPVESSGSSASYDSGSRDTSKDDGSSSGASEPPCRDRLATAAHQVMDSADLDVEYAASTDPVMLSEEANIDKILWANYAYEKATAERMSRKGREKVGLYLDPLGVSTQLSSVLYQTPQGTIVKAVLWGFLKKFVMPETSRGSSLFDEDEDWDDWSHDQIPRKYQPLSRAPGTWSW